MLPCGNGGSALSDDPTFQEPEIQILCEIFQFLDAGSYFKNFLLKILKANKTHLWPESDFHLTNFTYIPMLISIMGLK